MRIKSIKKIKNIDKLLFAGVTKFVTLMTIFIILFFSGCKKLDNEQIDLLIKVPTLSIKNSPDPAITESYQFLEKVAAQYTADYNAVHRKKVTVRVVCFPIAEETKFVSDLFDTDEAPDILYENFFNMETYIYTGRVVPLDDIITREIRSDVDELTWRASSANNKVYMMPYLSVDNVLCFNKDLFRRAGLDEYLLGDPVIQTWTLSEWERVLFTLKKELPENVFPMMMFARNEQGDSHIMTLLRSRGAQFFDGAGDIRVNCIQGVEALEWLLDCYKKGYFPPNSQSLEITQNSELFSSGQLAIYLGNSTLVNNFLNIDMGFVNFPSPTEGLSTSFLTGFEIFDNGNKKKIAAAKAFVKYIYTHPELMDYQASAIPTSKSVTERYKDKIFMLEAFQKNKKNIWNHTHNNPAWRGVRSVFFRHIQDLFLERRTPKEVAFDIDSDCNTQLALGRAKNILHR